MKIRRSAMEAINAHGAEGYPDEICGIMLGTLADRVVTEVRRARNTIVERSRDRYKIDDRDHMRIQRESDGAGLDIVGYYHSHPDHPAKPSKFDDEGSWEGYVFIIVSVQNGVPADINAFISLKDLAGPLVPEPMEII